MSDLYSRSPIDLERFKIPFTLFSSTNPPAFSILYFSSAKSGLWSTLISIATTLSPYFFASTALESPALATIISVGVIMAEQAVQPVPIAISSLDLPNKPALVSLPFLYYCSFYFP